MKKIISFVATKIKNNTVIISNLTQGNIPLSNIDPRLPSFIKTNSKTALAISNLIQKSYFKSVRFHSYLPQENDQLKIEFNCFNQSIDLYPIKKELPPFSFSLKEKLDLDHFHSIIYGSQKITISPEIKNRLNETTDFIQYLLKKFQNSTPAEKKKYEVYGINTGFADLRDKPVSADQAAKLSENIIRSHDAGTGEALPLDVVLGAMLVRANSLSKGYSGFQYESLNTLTQMINHRIIPIVPMYGSLGASGDLAYLAKLGRAMMGDSDAEVYYQGNIVSAKEALASVGISPMSPSAKEGLALTNGTSFSASMLAIGYLKTIHHWENALADQILFYNNIGAIDAAFYDCIQNVRGQKGQQFIAKFIRSQTFNSPLLNRKGTQNDYNVRCTPQILGPKIEEIKNRKTDIEKELNAATDNPLIFRGDEIGPEVAPNRKIIFNNKPWIVVSGGNFYAGYSAHSAEVLSLGNAEVSNLSERQHTYLLNSKRNNNQLPVYLIKDEKNAGLNSGHMITQYTHNAITTKLTNLANPISTHKIDSGNHSEDIVSYGSLAGIKLLEQLDLLEKQNTVKFVSDLQAYGIKTEKKNINPANPNLKSNQIFNTVKDQSRLNFPYAEEKDFEERYRQVGLLLQTLALRKIIDYPLLKY